MTNRKRLERAARVCAEFVMNHADCDADTSRAAALVLELTQGKVTPPSARQLAASRESMRRLRTARKNLGLPTAGPLAPEQSEAVSKEIQRIKKQEGRR